MGILADIAQFIREADNAVAGFFDWLNNMIKNTEYSFVTLVSTIIPWTTLLIPALLTRTNVGEILGYEDYLANIVGFNVAGLGIVTTSTYFSFVAHNRVNSRGKKGDKIPAALVWVPIALYVFYFVLVIAINVYLHTSPSAETVFWGNMALIFFEIPAVVIATIRMYQAEILRRKQSSESGGGGGSFTPYDYRTAIGALSDDEKRKLLAGGKSAIEDMFPGINPDYPARWIRNMKRDLGL